MSVQFKGGSIYKNHLFVVTNTELLIYELANFKLLKVFSLPTFNDLHGVLVTEDKIFICNTGLEIVQVFNHDLKLLEEICLTSYHTWERFDRSVDYRFIPTTKPHEVHANHLFFYNNELWVTRLHKFDCAQVKDLQRNIILIKDSGCHDGLVMGDYAYFSSVNGHIIRLNMETESVDKDIDLRKIVGEPVGWTRGLEVYDNMAFVGVSAVRPTKFKKFLKYLSGDPDAIKIPSTIYLIDLSRSILIDSFKFEEYPKAAVYSIIRYT